MKTLPLSEAKAKLGSLIDEVREWDEEVTITRAPPGEELEGLRNFRVGRFRIIFRTLDEKRTSEIAAIGPRSNIHEETLRLVTRDSRS